MRPEVSASAEGQEWVDGPDMDRGCINVCGSCYHCKPCTYLWSGLPPEAMFMSEGLAELCHKQGRACPCGLNTGDLSLPLTGFHLLVFWPEEA